MQRMAHALLLGAEVAQVVLVGRDLDGYVLDYLKTVGFEAYALYGIVGHEAHLMDAEMA